MIKLYHGTTKENLASILTNGLISGGHDTIWNCSDSDKMYLIKCELEDEDEDDYDYDESFEFAVSAARTAAAFYDSKSTDVIVFTVEIDEESFPDWEEYFEPDVSCENMADRGCFQIEKSDLIELVNTGKINLFQETVTDAYIQYLRPFYLQCFTSNEYSAEIKDPTLKKAIEIISEVDSTGYLDDLYYFERAEDRIQILQLLQYKQESIVEAA